MQLYVGPCHMVSAEVAVAMVCRLRIPPTVRCEVLIVFFLQADEVLGYLIEKASSRVELFCCTTMHVRMLSGRHTLCA